MVAPKPSRLLVVEDDAGLATLVSTLLAEEGYTCEAVGLGSSALEKFETGTVDLVLLDYLLPDMAADAVVAKAGLRMPPFLVLTGHGDEQVAVQLMKLGARDYLIKDATLLQRLPGSVARALEGVRVKRELENAQLALAQSKAELDAIQEHAPISMILLDEHRRVRRLNQAARAFLGRNSAGSMQPDLGALLGCNQTRNGYIACGTAPDCALCALDLPLRETIVQGTNHCRFEINQLFQQRSVLASTAKALVGSEPRVLLCLEDVTEQRRLEHQLRQSQKMEAVGQLAGGVAHDFNNILTVFLMHLSLLQGDTKLSEAMSDSLKELETQAQRAANLTRQLLLFSRRQVFQPRPVQLNDVLEAMLKMLRRLLGEHVVIDFRPSPHLPTVTADRGMLEQVVLNLCVNARDAMVRGGILQITTETVTIAPGSPLENRDARPGRFLRLTVTDSGCGMDDATLSRIFEPFFTTKEVGKGTGLGLATVFGIVKQHQGWVHARSVVGKGSTFLVYFPVEARGVAVPDETSPEPEASGGTETILLVEDDARVRRITATALRNKGYRVLEAPTGPEALAEWEKCGKQPDLLFSDMVMPAGMSGLELAERLRAQKPDLRVVLFSGYTADLLDIQGQRIKDFVYLAKPCSSLVLTRTVRECLDSRRNKAAAVHV